MDELVTGFARANHPLERLFAAEAKVWALLGAAPELATEGEAGWACGPEADSSQDGEEEEEGEEGEEGDEEVAGA